MSESFQYVGAMLMTGVLLGIVFDFYNTVTGASKWLRWLRPSLDLMYWLLAAVLTYHFTLVTDAGRFRLYTFGLLLSGFLVYRVTLHNAVCKSVFAVVHMIQKTCLVIWRLVFSITIRPLVFVLHLGTRCLIVAYHIGRQVENLICRVVAILLRVLMFPFGPILQTMRPLQSKFAQSWEGIWTSLSKWLIRKPDEV